MKIGMIGLGKLGLPVAVTMAMKGHDVLGFDIVPARMTCLPQEYQEAGPDGKGDFNEWLQRSSIRFGSLSDVVVHAEILFVAVQTPHDLMYEGITRLPDERVDFDYTHLREAMRAINQEARRPVIVAIISTVLPGTTDTHIRPIVQANANIRIVYTPSFIAMGTTMRDFLDPEFVLVGTDDDEVARTMRTFYKTIGPAHMKRMSVVSAELTKVAYNTYISLKIAFANTVMEICDKFKGADCDDVMGTLQTAYVRLISSAYLTGGMGDGGGCHPRDNIAMSWLARERGLSFDLFEAAMLCREKQAQWLAQMLRDEHMRSGLSVVILGKAFKPETNLIDGSPAILVGNILKECGIEVVYADDNVRTAVTEQMATSKPGVFLIGCRHARYESMMFPKGSTIIDPHRIIERNDNYTVRLLGAGVWSSG